MPVARAEVEQQSLVFPVVRQSLKVATVRDAVRVTPHARERCLGRERHENAQVEGPRRRQWQRP
jgi:hypothetical protein